MSMARQAATDTALYCVIDCAADPQLYGAVLQAGRATALFAGELHPDLAEAAPHLVQVASDSPLLTLLASPEGRAGAFGCVLRAHPHMGTIWRALRKHLLARMPDGNVVMFRFFDPRVMAPYLGSLTPQELAPWFTDISDWWLPLPDGTWHFTLTETGLARSVIPV
ncbi:DUF4123 domain-containing protein [Roseibaca sp. V10]|uniref:DUF4123 domain-containing protein n=1 Tax=Roseinatronobacter domitianus TaxID=2940293 RepID=A0ABT0M3I9_9RHOB|nr:DUF4123 domain-containing protein [Roseibaca domitiana]MCL1629218.1 DUF4123 domain-containing protein [Roseibaca domitiana]